MITQSKPMSPDTLAKGLIAKQGPERAAKICAREARSLIGSPVPNQPNPNREYFTNAFKYILKRYPKAMEK